MSIKPDGFYIEGSQLNGKTRKIGFQKVNTMKRIRTNAVRTFGGSGSEDFKGLVLKMVQARAWKVYLPEYAL